MAAFASSDSSQGATGTVAHGQGMEWDLDVDAFLDDYLKELGPEAQGPDHFGNISIDFAAPAAAQQGVLGAWGPSASACTIPVDSAAQQAPTMLTGQLQAQQLHSQQHQSQQAGSEGTAAVGSPHQLPAVSQQQQQQVPLPAATRSTRARKSAAGVAAASAAAVAAAAATSSMPSRATSTGGSRGSRETKKEMDLKKHLALQEKNRRAQRRFRERQKQRVAELEEQVASLQAQLEAAQSGGKQAASQHQQQAASEQGQPAAVPMPAAGGAAVRAVPSDADMMQDDCKQDAHASPRAVVGAQIPSSSSVPGSDEEPVLPAVSFDDALTLTVREGHPEQLSARELADMTPAELAKYYKAYVNELAGILVESDNPASHTTQDRVRRLVDEVCLLSTRSALCNPPGSKHFALTKVDDVPGQPADARVPQIARALDISHHQRKQLGQLRSLFLQKLARIAGERQEINAQLAGAIPGGTGNRHLCSRYLTAHDSARRLRQSLREEHILVLDFVSTIYKHVFTSQQVAQFMIQSYPWTPDCMALCTWVAAEDGDAEALGMLAADAQSKQQAAAAAAAAASGSGGPGGAAAAGGQASSGGSGNTLAMGGNPMGMPTPGVAATMGLQGPSGQPIFLPTAFAAAGMQSAAMFGQPVMVGAAGAHHHPPGVMAAGFNPAAALMHGPAGSEAMGGVTLVGQRWLPGSCVQSAGVHQPMTHAGSGCLPIPLGLSHLTGAGSGHGHTVMGGVPDLGGSVGGPGGVSAPISPHVATMSSANVEL